MRKVALRTAAGLCLLGAAVLGMPSSAGADTLQQQGWWYKLHQGATSALPASPPPPASVPEDGLYVANDPSGAAAISAVRFTSASAADGTLTLTITEGGAQGTPTLLACPVGGDWTAAQNGAWEERPPFATESCTVQGQVDAAASTVTFAVPASFNGGAGSVDVVIVPGGTTPFSVAFDKPTDGSFVSTSASSGGTADGSTGTASEFSTDPSTSSSGASDPSASSGSFSADSSSSASGSTGSFTPSGGSSFDPSAGAADFAAPETPPVAAGAAPSSGSSSTGSATGTGQQAAAPAAATDSGNDAVARIVAGVLLALVAIGLFLASGAAIPVLTGGAVPAALLAQGSERPRGIGRFSRARTGPPTGLT